MSKPDHPTTDKATANLIVALREFLDAKFKPPGAGKLISVSAEFPELLFEHTTCGFPPEFKVSVMPEWWLTMGSNGPLTITDDPEWVRPWLKDSTADAEAP